MAFDVQGALNAGYSKEEIAEYLGQQSKFDSIAARQSGYTDDEIIQHLSAIEEPKSKLSKFVDYLKTVPLEDPTKAIVAPIIQGVASAPAGIETALRAVPRMAATGELAEQSELLQLGKRLLGAEDTLEEKKAKELKKQQVDQFIQENIPRVPGLQDLASGGEKIAKGLRESMSQEAKEAIRGSQIEGNLLEAVQTGDYSKLSFGQNPTLYGYTLNTLDALGSLYPVIIGSAIGTKTAATVGGGMAAGEASKNASDYIKSKSDTELSAASPYYKDLRSSGVDESLARKIITDRAAEQAAFLQGSIATLGGAATERILSGAADKIIGAAGRNKLGRIAAGGALGAAEEGAQEFLEGIASDLGINKEVIKEIGQDSFSNLIMGMIAGGPAGMARGAVMETESDKKAQEEVRSAESTKAMEQARLEPEFAREEKALAALGITPEEITKQIAPAEAELKPAEEAPIQERAVEPVVEPEVITSPVEEAPEIPLETRIPERELELPIPAEIAELDKQAEELSRQIKRAETVERGPSLASVLKNRLSESEASDITPEPNLARYFRMSPKRGKGQSISDILSNTNDLDDFIDPQYLPSKDDDPTLATEKEKGAIEYIKEKIRDQNYLTFDTEMRLKELGYNLKQVEAELDRELTDEQIRAEANAIAAEIAAEEGLSRPEEAPEEGAVRGVAERVAEPREPEEGVGFKQVTPSKKLINEQTGQTITSPFLNEVANQGYKMLPLDSPKTYKDKGNNAFRTFEKDGVRVSFSTQKQIYADPEKPGRKPGTFIGKDTDVVFENIYVEPSKRKKGMAKNALQEITKIADSNNFTIYLEPVQLEKSGIKKENLVKLYQQFGFKATDPDSRVMRRDPRTSIELKAETAEETVSRQEQEDFQREKLELKKIADLERDLFKLEQESNPTKPPIQQSLFDVTNGTPSPIVNESSVTPSFTREFDRLSKALDRGDITSDEFATMVQAARKEAIDARKLKPIKDRVRGMDFIIERLRNGLRHGALTEETVELTEWFMKQNPALVDDLGISIRSSDEKGTSGQYFPTPRVVKLIAGSDKTDTAVHEILHHLERMMPERIRNDIVKSWARQYASAKKAAQETGDKSLIEFFNLLDQHHSTGRVAPFNEAVDLIKNGNLDYVNYQFVNPSEFWAVNASKIVQGRFDVRAERLGALKKWLSDFVQKIKDILKMKSDAPIIRALDSLAKSDGKFVSTEMLAGTGIYPNVRTNIFGGTPPNPSWGRPDDSKVDDVVVVLQDKMVDTKQVIKKIEEAQGKLKDRWDAYLQEELYHGRTAKQTNDFLQKELSPLLKEIQSKGFTIADVEEYLQNRHSEERNIQVAKVNPNMPDGGSGIMTADAQSYLAGLNTSKKSDLEAIAKKVDAITAKTRHTLIQNGIEDPKTIAAWEGAYKNYVPLAREENDYEISNIGRGVGQGFSVRGPTNKRAVGSARQVVDILANIAMQRERAIVRSEKNRVGQAVYGLAIQHPNTDFWLAIDPDALKDPQKTINDLNAMGINGQQALQAIMAEPTETYVDPRTGTVSQRIKQSFRGSDYSLALRVNGKDKFVFFNTSDPRAVRMVYALKNLDAEQLSKALSIVARITRYFAAINTQYNPIFGLWNFSRDVLGSTLNLTTTPINDKTKQVIADTFPALGGIYAELRARRAGKTPPTTGWAGLWDEFQKEGGQTGFRDQFSKSEERTEALQRELNRITEGKPVKAARVIFDWLSDYNETMENAVRLSAYKAALDKGLTKERAASVAKNLTVNFNRKGQIARQTNALYAFFNASVQGTARMYQTIKGPAGKKIMAGGLGLGIVQALTLMAFGFDEDEPPDFIKERNIVIPVGGKKYVTIPMPLGFNVIPNTSRVLTEWAMSGFKDTSKRVAQITGAVLEMFNPIGNAGWSFQTFAPTIADPAVALFENKDWTGKPIAKKDLSSLDPTPGYTRAKDTASWFSKNLAEFLNYASGGTKYRPGEFSPTPDQIDYLIGQITGGVGREAMKVEQTIRSSITGEELPTYKIPLFGRLVGSAEEQAAQRDKFYNNIKLLNEHENEIQGRRENREPIDDYLIENPEARLSSSANAVEKQIQNLRQRREYLIKNDAPKELVKEVEQRITDVMVRFNERVKQAKENR